MDRKILLKQILRDWQDNISSRKLFSRELFIPPPSGNYILTLTGPRRSGKTSILQIMAKEWTEKHPKTPALYINFEDERLELTTEELSLLLDCYRELYPEADQKNLRFFFDEIQVVPDWERFVRRCHESERARIVVTGSNSKALSSDIATSLRGRTINAQVLPLSFREFYKFKTNQSSPPVSSRDKAKGHLLLHEYLKFGGFPDVVLEPNERVKPFLLQEYFQVMILRDLVERYKIQQVPALKFFLKRLLASSARPLSIHKIYQELRSAGHSISKDRVYEFIDYAESVYFVRRLEQHSRKVVNRELGERKVYPIDCGYLYSILGSSDLTKALEAAVFFDFLFRGEDISYYKGKHECDFILNSTKNSPKAFQVSYSLDDKDTETRELGALNEACKALNLGKGQIITAETSGQTKYDGLAVKIVSFMQFTHG